MKLIFLLMILSGYCNTVYSRSETNDLILRDTITDGLDLYSDVFLGIWTTVDSNEIYEIEFEKRMVYFKQIDKYSLMILGSIKKMRGKQVICCREIRDTNVVSSDLAPLTGSPLSSKVLSLFYEEPGENKELGKVEFTLSDDKQTATWVLRGTVDLKIINIQKYERFEIPYEMTFKRKRDHEK